MLARMSARPLPLAQNFYEKHDGCARGYVNTSMHVEGHCLPLATCSCTQVKQIFTGDLRSEGDIVFAAKSAYLRLDPW